MATLVSRLGDIQERLDALARQHRVAGASLGIMAGSEFLEFATGLANKNTGVEVTPQTLFQIGSNTKVLNTTLVMQLVDSGEVDLDSPVRKYVDDLQLADPDAAESITVRNLVTHTSGIQGDYFAEFGRGDDCLELYCASLKDVTQVHDPNELFSYCNTGFCLAGLVIERVTGKPWHEVIRERLFTPLQMHTTTVLLEEMVAHRYAVGHTQQPGQREPQVPGRVMMSRAHGPAGSLTSSTPRELLRFVRCHLEGGLAPDGTRLLSEASVRAMQEPQVERPAGIGQSGQVGLSWMLADWDGHRVIGHGGGTIGQLSFLQVLPDDRFAVALFTNSATGGNLWQDLGRYMFEDIAGVAFPETPKAPSKTPDLPLAKYTGRYERLGVDTEVTVEDGQLVMTVKSSSPLAPDAPPQRIRLRAIDKELFVGPGPAGAELLVSFLKFDSGGVPKFVHSGGRASRRADAAPSGGRATSRGGGRGAARGSRRSSTKSPRRGAGPRPKAKRPKSR